MAMGINQKIGCHNKLLSLIVLHRKRQCNKFFKIFALLFNKNTLQRSFIIFCCLLLTHSAVIAQSYLKKNEHFHQMVNGLKLLVIEDPSATKSQIILTVNSGTSHENKNGLGTAEIVAALVSKQIQNNNLPDYTTETFLANDYTSYYTEFSGNEHLFTALKSLVKAMVSVHNDTGEINNAKAAQIKNITSASELNDVETASAKIIFGENFFRLGILPTDSLRKTPGKKEIAAYKKVYYCPQNAFIIVYGNYKRNAVHKTAINTLLDWKDCTYNASQTMPIGLIRTNELNSQSIDFIADSAAISLSLLQPTTVIFKSRKEVLCGMLFSSLLRSDSCRLNLFLKDSMKIRAARFDFKSRKFAAVSKLTFHFDTTTVSSFLPHYNNLNYLSDTLLLAENDIETAKRKLTESLSLVPEKKEYMKKLSEYNALTSIDYYAKVADSINALTQKDLIHFIQKHISGNHFAATLKISENNYAALGIDSFFVPTACHPSEYEFMFAKNTNRIEGNADSVLNSMAQWIKINPKENIKINGVAVNDELLTVRDNEMLNFYRQNPQFKIMPEGLIPTKNIRLDVYRSMSIVKHLVDRGVPIHQLTGTGKIISKEAAEKENGMRAYCTIRVL
jgi:predicted Zn-dependent peptidase